MRFSSNLMKKPQTQAEKLADQKLLEEYELLKQQVHTPAIEKRMDEISSMVSVRHYQMRRQMLRK